MTVKRQNMTVKSQLLFLILITLIFAFSSLFLGVAEVPLQALTNGSQDAWFTVLTSRIPRLFSLILAGAGLAVCGVILQQVVQNKFAEPATTGGLDAAKLGVLIAVIQWPEFGIQGKALSALLFCLLTSSVFCAFFTSNTYKKHYISTCNRFDVWQCPKRYR